MNPHLKAATAVHPSSEHLPVARANGITHAVVAPGRLGGFGGGGAGISGQASIVHLDGWTVEEMDIDASAGMVLTWPTYSTRTFNPGSFQAGRRSFSEAEEEYDRAVAELAEVLDAARRYAAAGEADARERDIRLAALGPVVGGEMPLLILAQGAREIRHAVEFTKEQGVKMILLGGNEAWKVKELLAENAVPVILGPTQRLPGEEDDPYDRPFTTPGELHEAGVTVAFASFGSSNSRLLPYEAGHAVGYGLPARRRDPRDHSGSRAALRAGGRLRDSRRGEGREPDRGQRGSARDPHRGGTRFRERSSGLARQPAPAALREVPSAPEEGAVANRSVVVSASLYNWVPRILHRLLLSRPNFRHLSEEVMNAA